MFQADNDGHVPAGLDAVGIIPTRVINSDFLGFQSDFTTQRRKADCDRDRAFTIFDFFCFQSYFDAGCL